MERALRYFALAFFFSFPAFFFPADWSFSGFPPVWLPFLGSFEVSRYEWAKLAFLALFALVFPLGTLFLKYREIEFPKISPIACSAFVAVGLFWLSSWMNPGFPFFETVAWKTYSVLPFFALFAVGFSVSAYGSGFRWASLTAFSSGFLIVNLPYAFFQILGHDPFSQSALLPWEGVRAFWTLGNPNSLAFLAVGLLPLAYRFFKKGAARTAVVASILGIVAMSWSWSGMAVSAGYLSYRYFWFGRTAFFSIVAVMAFSVVSSVAESSVLLQEKRLSLSTRAAIVWDSAAHAVSSPRAFLLGDGAWAAGRSFSEYRSAELANRVDSSIPIDRTHFFFLDVAIVFWMPFAFAVFLLGFLMARKTERPVREALSVLLFMSCMHTPTSAHLLFAILLLVSGLRVPKKPAPSAWTA